MNNKFWNKIAKDYDKNTERIYASTNEKVIETTKKYCKKQSSLFDIGCGTGMLTIALADFVDYIYAVDSSAEMLKIAKEKASQKNITNINWKCGDILEKVALGKNYDIITAFNLLLYLKEPDKLLASIYDLLEEDGYFISITDCVGEKLDFSRKIQVLLSKIGILPYIQTFKIDDLSKMMKNAGFEIIFSENFYTSPPNYFIVAKKSK